jgi:antitoxin ParD1/3/4
MQKNTSITLGNHFDKFLNEQINTGRFGSVSEAVRAGLRLLEERECKIQALKKALTEGENSGKTDYSFDTFINEIDKE